MRALKIFKHLVLPMLCAWFFLTIFVDIFTVPTVFRTIGDITTAGKVGIKVFTAMNRFELIFAIIVMIGSFSYLKLHKSIKWLVASIVMFAWSLLYNLFLTPMITNTTFKINETAVEDPMYAVLQATHAQYHNLYRYFDTAKLVVLLVLMIIVVLDLTKKEKN